MVSPAGGCLTRGRLPRRFRAARRPHRTPAASRAADRRRVLERRGRRATRDLASNGEGALRRVAAEARRAAAPADPCRVSRPHGRRPTRARPRRRPVPRRGLTAKVPVATGERPRAPPLWTMTAGRQPVMLSERDAAPAGTMNEGTRDEQSLGRRHIIERPRLTRLLDECEARVILLVAPAGYGKTTLAREWTTGSERSASWCTLAVGAGDIAVSSQLLGVALDRIAPGAASRMTSRLRHSSGPQSEPVDLARVLAAGVESWPPDSWLVIDDYHAGANDVTDRFFEEFVNQCGQVLITSRQRPRWATSRRLMYGEFYELGAAALAMTHEEAFEVLGSRGAESRGFFALADGWPAVIGLGAMANPSIVAADRTPEDLHDFLAQEVLSTISEEAQGAVCRLALLPTLEDAAG